MAVFVRDNNKRENCENNSLLRSVFFYRQSCYDNGNTAVLNGNEADVIREMSVVIITYI